jgi:Regulator of Chromosome Condensation (RCC1) repeat protein/regulator of chromosome condensation (RCC1) repeat-containing protein
MHESRYRRCAAALGFLGVAITMSCGESPTAARQFGPPGSLTIVTGNRQRGIVGQGLPEPLTVQVLDSAGHPLWAVTVNWSVVTGNGTLFARAVPTQTDSAGLVAVFWQLGGGVGQQEVIAHVGQALTVAFSATAEIPASQQVSLVSGGGQQDTVGATLAQPLVIRVVHPDGTPDSGAAVSWRAISRGSTYAPPNTKTDAQGVASTSWTLGTVAGFESTAVFIAGFTPRLIVAIARPGNPVRIAMTPTALPVMGVVGDTVWASAYTWDRYNNSTNRFPIVHVADTTIADTSGGYAAYYAIRARHHGSTFVIAQVDGMRDSLPLTVLGFSGISAGGGQCAVSLAGDTYCWGENSQGTIGDGTTTYRRHPVLIGTGLGLRLPSTGTHTCALDASGHAFCWGPDASGELGDGSPNYATELRQTLPVAVAGGHVFTSIRTGRSHSCAVDTNGDAYCWGDNGIGQLGRDTLTNTCYLNAINRCSNQPIPVAGGLKFTQVSASPWEHSCGVTTGGAAYCWGSNGTGQLGTDATTDQCGVPTPYACSRVPVPVKGGIVFKSVSAGDVFTCGVSTSGDGYCWGYGYYGQLGNGAFNNSTVPVKVAGGLSFADVQAASNYACGLTTTGGLYCWGGNQATPGHVDFSYSFISFSLASLGGSTRVCALTTDNDLHC